MAYFTSYFVILIEGSSLCERLRQKFKFCYFLYSFYIFCKTFVLIARPFCIFPWTKNEKTQMLICRLRFSITKCASNEWC